MVEGLDMTLEQLIKKSKDSKKQQQQLQLYGNSGGSGTVTGGSGGGTVTGRNRNFFHGHENRALRAGRFSMDRNACNTEPYYMLPPSPPPPPPPPPAEHQMKKTAEKRKLHLSNLHFEVTENDIKVLLSDVGPLEYYIIHYDKSGRSKGTADVVFEQGSDAVQAFSRYNNLCLHGRKLKIEFGVEINTTHSPPALKDIGGTSGLNRRFASSAPCDVGDKYRGTSAMYTTPANEHAVGTGECAKFKHAPFPKGDLLATYGSGAAPLTDDIKGFQMRNFRSPGPQRADWNQRKLSERHKGFNRENISAEALDADLDTFCKRQRKSGMRTYCTSIIALKGKDFIAMGVDSRVTSASYGHVVDDNKIKLRRVFGNFYGTASGDAELSEIVYGNARKNYMDKTTKSPKSVIACAQHVEDLAVEWATNLQPDGTTEFIVFGMKKRKFHIYRLTCKSLKKRTGSGALVYECEVEEVGETCTSGSGSQHMVEYLKNDDRYPLTSESSVEEAKDLVKSAMEAARRRDCRTDGPLRAVTLTVDGGVHRVRIWGAEPVRESPDAPFGEWIEDAFVPIQ